jgi:hypothetical protein
MTLALPSFDKGTRYWIYVISLPSNPQDDCYCGFEGILTGFSELFVSTDII